MKTKTIIFSLIKKGKCHTDNKNPVIFVNNIKNSCM